MDKGLLPIISAAEARRRMENCVVRKFREMQEDAIERGQDYVALLGNESPAFFINQLTQLGYRIEMGENRVCRVFW